MKLPKQVEDVKWVKTGEFYTLVSSDNKTFDVDSIGFLIWSQCDGKTPVDKIVDIFAVGGNKDVVKASIAGILDKLEEAGLIKWI